jgi:GNAT superfamily N-acetyltransferase
VTDIQIRFAIADDAALLLEFIRELAAYERAPDAVVASEDDLRRHGFGPERHFEALLAFVEDKPAGFALFYPDFSTWHGRPGLYLEDLYVKDWARRRGVGRRLIARLAAIAIERGWPDIHFNVLDWNPARGFYHRLGIAPREEWRPYAATGDALRRLAAEDAR